MIDVGATPGFMPKRNSALIGHRDAATDGAARPEIGDEQGAGYVAVLALLRFQHGHLE
jgi:hypothetical protein